MPRSSSRDLSDRFIGFRRYFQARTIFESWKIRLSLLALVVVSLWAAWSFLAKANSQSQLSPGPLTSHHATWDTQCEACHRPKNGSPISAGWNELSCQRCHSVAKHAAAVSDRDANDCASCHRDHNGRDFSLTKLSDSTCSSCHANLAGNATNFSTNHPPFNSITIRRSTINFSHAQHLSPGIVVAKDAKNALLKEGQSVQLDCASCHTLSRDGSTYQPIRFDVHCMSCHEQKAPSVVTNGKQVLPPFGVKHGSQLADLTSILLADYSLKLQSQHPNLLTTTHTDDLAMIAFQAEVKNSTDAAMKYLSIGCKKCHISGNEVVAKTAIPEVWMTKAKFNHAAHRSTGCVTCHSTATEWNEREPVQIPGIDNCRQCHAPKSSDPAKSGGVKHACTDCHNYHARSHPTGGPPEMPLSLRELLGPKSP